MKENTYLLVVRVTDYISITQPYRALQKAADALGRNNDLVIIITIGIMMWQCYSSYLTKLRHLLR
ncbi:MAG: hypothetical protein ABS960_09005 [Solibacillus isronensis]